jgi:predicted dehydrogenase
MIVARSNANANITAKTRRAQRNAVIIPQMISRRRLIQSSAAILAASALSRFSFADAPSKPLGFAFVGLGRFAIGQLLPGITRCKFCKPVALVSGHPDKAHRVAAHYNIDSKNIYNYDNFDSIKNNPDIDVVYVVLPNSMHAEYTIRALQAGKNVMCEKPMANTSKECEQMIAAAKSTGKRLQIGYRMHWDAPTLACIQMLRKGDIGSIQLIENAVGFTIGDPTQWRLNRKLAGGGCLMDIGIYCLNAARYFTAEEPVEVSAQTYQDTTDPHFKEVEQSCDFQLKFPSGAMASCISSYTTNMNRFAIHGNHGQCVLEPGEGYSGARLSIDRGQGLEPQNIPPSDQFTGEMDGFAQALAGNAPFKATGEEGLRDLRIIEAIYESARTGKSITM